MAKATKQNAVAEAIPEDLAALINSVDAPDRDTIQQLRNPLLQLQQRQQAYRAWGCGARRIA